MLNFFDSKKNARIRQKLISTITAAALIFTGMAAGVGRLTASAAVSDTFTDSNGIKYQITAEPSTEANGTVEVERNSYTQSIITIPATVTNSSSGNTYDVTSIGEKAFINCTSLTGITIPNSVTSIGEWAFSGCTGLTCITIPDSVASINYAAFSGCANLVSIAIPNSVTSIEEFAFYCCTKLTSITIPNSVTSIESYAFSYSGIKNVYFGGDLPTTISSYALNNCPTSLKFYYKSGASGYSDSYTCLNAQTISISSGISHGAIEPSTNLTPYNNLAMAGETVILKITPDEGYTLKSGSLKYTVGSIDTAITGTSFAMQPTDVTVTGEFELVPVPLFTSADGVTNDSTPTWSWSDQAGYGYYRYKLDGAADWTTTASNSYTPSTALSVGAHTLEVEDMNSAGDWSLSASSSVTVNTTAPTVSLSSPDGTDVSLSTASIGLKFSENVTAVADGTVTVSDGSNTYTYTISVGDGYVTDNTAAIPISAFKNSSNASLTFAAGTTYTVSVSAGAYINADGNAVEGGEAGSFTTKNNYTVTFDNNGGSGASPSTASAADGGTVTLPTTNPTYSGYVFAGWNTKADGSGTAFTAATAVSSDITVYAQWSKNSTVGSSSVSTLTVTFNKNGGDTAASPASATAAYGGKATLPATNPTRSGYVFAGWNTKADGSGTAFTAATAVTSNITVYAQWTTSGYTVTFDENGGDTAASPATASAADGGTVALPATNPTRTGYTFAGWNTETDGTGTAFTASTAVTDNITVYAQWTQNSCGVSYASHVQSVGWQSFACNGTLSGTTGKTLRDEAIKVMLTGDIPDGASIIYQVHVQSKGWMKPVSDGGVAGTTGQSLRLEALRITLSGLDGYAVKYRAYVQSKGWMDWQATENGTDITDAGIAGTTGKALRIEAVEIVIEKAK